MKKQTGDSGRAANTALTEAIEAAKEAGRQQWLARRTSDETPINPYRVMWDLMHTVDRSKTMITHDSGNPRDQLLTTWEALIPRGYLGWGKSTQLGTGLGVAVVVSRRPGAPPTPKGAAIRVRSVALSFSPKERDENTVA